MQFYSGTGQFQPVVAREEDIFDPYVQSNVGERAAGDDRKVNTLADCETSQ